MSDGMEQVDEILDQLVKEVEASVHALYRGDHRQHTMKSKAEVHRRAARDAMAAMMSGHGITASGDEVQGGSLTPEELEAITRCVMAWLPMGAPSEASPQSRCVPAARELAPSWGEREKARVAARRISG